MSNGRRGMTAGRAGLLAAVALVCGVGSALAGDPATGDAATGAGAGRAAAAKARPLPGLKPGATLSAETVHFADPRSAPVRVMRGPRNPASPLPPLGPAPGPAAGRTEIVSFGTGFAERVTVVRGITTSPAIERPSKTTRVHAISSDAFCTNTAGSVCVWLLCHGWPVVSWPVISCRPPSAIAPS